VTLDAPLPSAASLPRRRRGAALDLARFGADPLRFLDGLRGDERDLVPFRLGRFRCRLVAAPAAIGELLESEDWPPLSRGRLSALDLWYSGGLILTEGAEHHRQRDALWRPLVADPRLLETAARRGARRVDAWAPDRPFELHAELRALCRAIDWETLTGRDLDETPELLADHERGIDALVWLLGPFGRARWSAPLPGSARVRAARRRLDAVIDGLLREERERPDGERGALLAQLVRLAADGAADDDLIRATVKQWLGADQLHAALTWTLSLLARHPGVEARWHEELDAVLGDRAPGPDDTASLPYTRRVLAESLRLYPPIWGFFRQLTAPWSLAGEELAAGDLLALSPWFTHRDARLWPDPGRFDPDRWDGAHPVPGAYFPYSAGPYGCPAESVSWQEGALLLAAIGRKWTLRPADAREPRPLALGTIVPKGGLRMVATPRR
jgi:cytochrome P450